MNELFGKREGEPTKLAKPTLRNLVPKTLVFGSLWVFLPTPPKGILVLFYTQIVQKSGSGASHLVNSMIWDTVCNQSYIEQSKERDFDSLSHFAPKFLT